MTTKKKCSVQGCKRKVHAKGLCGCHYQLQRVSKITTNCSAEGCDRRAHTGGLCKRHYSRVQRRGSYEPIMAEKGAGYITPAGYHRIYVEGRYIETQRFVMEQQLGRQLQKGENVHHINGDKLDNRPENLELWVTSQPRGQRAKDLVKWAKEILARYGDLS